MNPPRTPTPIQAAEGERENGGMQASPRTHCYRPAVTPPPRLNFLPVSDEASAGVPQLQRPCLASLPLACMLQHLQCHGPHTVRYQVATSNVAPSITWGNLRNDQGHVIVKVPSASRKPVRQVLVIYPLAVLIIAELGNFFT